MPAPQYVLRSYGGGAVVAQLTEAMGSGDQSFAINPTTNWLEDDGNPLGTVGPFTVVIDRFTASVEKILCSSVDLVTGVVEVYVDPSDGWSGRGYDGTAPQAHVPGGSPSGVQTCWSSAEAMEANQAVFDVLGGGSEGLIGVPIGSSVPFNGTPLTLPTNFLVEDGLRRSPGPPTQPVSPPLIIASTGTTTAAGATIYRGLCPRSRRTSPVRHEVSTLTASAGAIYTVQSVTSTTIVLTSGVGITAATGGAFIVYPYGAGDGSTTFNLPDSRGRSKVGQGHVNTNTQPLTYVGGAAGVANVTISQSNLPTAIGTAAAQTATVSPSSHSHTSASPASGFYVDFEPTTLFGNDGSNSDHSPAPNMTVQTSTAPTTIGVTNATSAVTNSGGGSAMNVLNPYIGCTWIIRVT